MVTCTHDQEFCCNRIPTSSDNQVSPAGAGARNCGYDHAPTLLLGAKGHAFGWCRLKTPAGLTTEVIVQQRKRC